MNVIVLGGRGFIGNHVVARLRAVGHEVSTVGRTTGDAGGAGEVEHITCDLFDAEAPLCELLSKHDACIHLVGDLVPGSAEKAGWDGYVRNLLLAERLASACIAAGIGHLVFASSGGTVYGRDVLGATEDMACRPIGLYGAQKLAIESLLRARLLRSRTRLVLMRVCNPYGMGQESQRAHGVIGRILNGMRNGSSFTIWGDGTQVRDYVHVRDVADAFAKAIDYAGESDTFNIGSGRGITMDELLASCADVTGVTLSCSNRPKAEYEVDRISLDISLASQYLHWRPEASLGAGLYSYYQELLETT